ncbi:MAG: amidohydrolase [Acidobacteriia bacterium]|nr:amidohydrolase [Terriglobia bacterium]
MKTKLSCSSIIFTACLSTLLGLTTPCTFAQVEPIIDMHLHALHANELGPPPLSLCAPFPIWPVKDTHEDAAAYFARVQIKPTCDSPLRSPLTDDELMRRTIEILRARNVVAVTAGDLDMVEKWKQAGGDHILPATPFDPESGKPTVDELRQLVKGKRVFAFSEVSSQYEGISVTDPRMEPYFALAEELDVPVGIHMGPGPPGAPYVMAPNYRMRLSSLLLLEDVLVRHPKLRVWAMHAGWPLADDAIAALYAHPQLYVDVGIISYAFPRKQFYDYVQRLIDAGFENRIMFGSDEMVWPDAESAAIDTIQNAPSLTAGQKRDILYNNAARFLRLKP